MWKTPTLYLSLSLFLPTKIKSIIEIFSQNNILLWLASISIWCIGVRRLKCLKTWCIPPLGVCQAQFKCYTENNSVFMLSKSLYLLSKSRMIFKYLLIIFVFLFLPVFPWKRYFPDNFLKKFRCFTIYCVSLVGRGATRVSISHKLFHLVLLGEWLSCTFFKNMTQESSGLKKKSCCRFFRYAGKILNFESVVDTIVLESSFVVTLSFFTLFNAFYWPCPIFLYTKNSTVKLITILIQFVKLSFK